MDADSSGEAVQLVYASPEGEEGYPGAVDFTVVYRLEGPRLVCEMTGRPDRPTPIARELIPDGTIRPVAGTRFDFNEARSLAEADPEASGYDINLVLAPGRDAGTPAARVTCARTGLRLELWTGEPGLQVYDSAGVTIAAPGLDGARYGSFAGLCLEAQHYPDSLHNPDWPSIIRSPEAPYFQRLEVQIGRQG
jgi:aldose 1-epimerase